MKYILLICEDPALRPSDPADQEAMSKEYAAFTDSIIASGELAAGERLHGTETATSVRVRDGKRALVDGPFAETTEHIGGYYVVDVANLDRAVELAAELPAAGTGVVEVRPIWEM
jgi:hypothetical protein